MIKKTAVKGKGKGKNRVKLTFVLPADHSHGEVSVVGDFNDWDPAANKFVRRSNQTYSTSVTVEADGRYAFRYYGEDGRWINEEDADAYEASGYGSENCIVTT